MIIKEMVCLPAIRKHQIQDFMSWLTMTGWIPFIEVEKFYRLDYHDNEAHIIVYKNGLIIIKNGFPDLRQGVTTWLDTTIRTRNCKSQLI